MRKGIKPCSFPKTGTYWRSTECDAKHHWQQIVAVLEVTAGYAKMGFRSDAVVYTAGLSYAVNDSMQQHVHKRVLPRDKFLSCFKLIEDEEVLSEELGMHALAYYG